MCVQGLSKFINILN